MGNSNEIMEFYESCGWGVGTTSREPMGRNLRTERSRFDYPADDSEFIITETPPTHPDHKNLVRLAATSSDIGTLVMPESAGVVQVRQLS